MVNRLLLLFAVAVPLATIAPADARRVDAGVFVGYHEPLSQDDATDDLVLGGRLRMPLRGPFVLEPSFQWFEMDRGPYRIRGVPQEVQEWRIVAGTLGLSVGPELGRRHLYRPYAYAGAGLYFLRKDEAPDSDRFGLEGGVGVSAELSPAFELDARLTLTRVSLEQGGARSIMGITGGLYYSFGKYRTVRR